MESATTMVSRYSSACSSVTSPSAITVTRRCARSMVHFSGIAPEIMCAVTYSEGLFALINCSGSRSAPVGRRLLRLRRGRDGGKRLLAEAVGYRVVLLGRAAHRLQGRPLLVAERRLAGGRPLGCSDSLGGRRM